LVLLDHDLSAERAMLVFGGEPCACVRVLKMWSDQFGMPPEQFALMRKWLGANAFLAPEELDLIRRMGMVLSWERAWRRGAYLSKHERLLDGELQGRALPALRGHLNYWKERAGARVVAGVDVRVIRSDHIPHLTGSISSVSVKARLTLAGDWPAQVWGRGMATVGEAFVLEVTDTRRDALGVRAVRWQEQPGGGYLPVEARARARPGGSGGGDWELEWEEASATGSGPGPPPGAAGDERTGERPVDPEPDLVDFDPAKGWQL